MRNLFKNSMLFLVMQALLIGAVFSSDRVDYLIEEDSIHELDSIQEQLYQLDQLKFQLERFELHMSKKPNGENVYLKFERVAGTAVLAGLIAGSVSVYFPPGTRAMISAYITAHGLKGGMVKINDKDANKIISDLVILKKKVASSQKTLVKTSKYYCKLVASHDICP